MKEFSGPEPVPHEGEPTRSSTDASRGFLERIIATKDVFLGRPSAVMRDINNPDVFNSFVSGERLFEDPKEKVNHATRRGAMLGLKVSTAVNAVAISIGMLSGRLPTKETLVQSVLLMAIGTFTGAEYGRVGASFKAARTAVPIPTQK